MDHTRDSKGSRIADSFRRTHNLALPMAQRKITKDQQEKIAYSEFFKERMKTFAGIPHDSLKRKTLDDTPQQREAFYEAFWRRSLCEFWPATYEDVLYSDAANSSRSLQILGEQTPRSHL
jgi:hypothetical protein